MSRLKFLLLLYPVIALGQGSQLPKYTVATLPSASAQPSYTVQVIDGANDQDCVTGGGNKNVLCKSRSGAWFPVSPYQSLTTSGTSGPATLNLGVLNVPDYAAAAPPPVSSQLQPLIQAPVAGQYVIIYPTTCSTSSDVQPRIPIPSCLANGTAGSAQIIQEQFPSGFPPVTATVTFGGFALPAGIPAANVTSVYVAGVSHSQIPGNAFVSRNCAGSAPILPNLNSWSQQQVTTGTGLAGTGIATLSCSIQISNSGTQNGTSEFNLDSVVAIAYYTGMSVGNPNNLNIAAPLSFNSSTNTLGVDPSFPSWLNAIPVAQLPSPSGTVNRFQAVSNSADCSTTSAGQHTLCWSGDGTAGSWIPYTGSGLNQLTGDVLAGPGSGSQVATLATVNSNVGTCGDSTHVGQVTLNAKGLTTACTPVAISGGSGGVSGSGTTGFLPKWTGSTALGNSAIDDGITTASTITSTEPFAVSVAGGQGGTFNATEGTAASATSGHDILYADSTAHCLEYSANGGSFTCLGTGGSSTALISRVSCVTYGCVADGNLAANTGTDNTTPLTNCLAAAITAKGFCYAPAGVYRIATSLPTINTGSTGFVGDVFGYTGNWVGPATTIFSSSASATILTISSGLSTYISGDRLQGISLQRGVAHSAGSIALLMDHADEALISYDNFQDSGTGIDLTNSPSAGVGIIEHNLAQWGGAGVSCGTGPNIGFNLHGGGSGFKTTFLQWNAVNSLCAVTSYAYKADGAIVDLNLANNTAAGTSYGVYFNGTLGQDVHVVDQIDDSCLIECEYFNYAGGGTTTELRGGWATAPTGATADTDLDNTVGVKISERQYFGQSGGVSGVLVHNGSTGNAIENNTFTANAPITCNGANHNNYTGNTANGNFTWMTFVNCSNNAIASNTSHGSGSVDVTLDSNSNNNTSLTANSWGSSASPQFTDAGTGNQAPLINVASAPSGACTLPTPAQYVTTTGHIWGCQSSVWADLSSGGAVSSVSNSDSTLIISPTTGAVVGSLNLAHANVWTGLQTLVATNVTGLPAASVLSGALVNGMTATTQAPGTNNTTLATMAAVQAAIAAAGTGAGIVTYSGPSLTFSGTKFFPIGGGGLASGTETDVDIDSPAAVTIQNMTVQMSGAIGSGNTVTYTWRKNAAPTYSGATDTVLTCTVNGSSAAPANSSCSDTTHDFSTASLDQLDIKAVTTGTILGTPTVIMAAQVGIAATATAAFSAISGGTNTTAAMVVGSGASLVPGGTGTITANGLTGSPAITVSSCTGCGGGGAWTNISGTITPTNATCTSTSCTTSGTQTSVAFSIPGGYNSIIIKYAAVSSVALAAFHCTLNSDAGSNYVILGPLVVNTSFAANSAAPAAFGSCGLLDTLGSFGRIELPFYTVTTMPRNIYQDSGGFASISSQTNNGSGPTSSLWNNTSTAVTSIQLNVSSGNIASGAQFVIYGVN